MSGDLARLPVDDTVSLPDESSGGREQRYMVVPEAFGRGRYQVKRLLGKGGQKWVYLGRDLALERDVVIAVLKTAELDEAAVSRLRREATTMAQLGAHPNIVTVFDIGEERGQPFVISEYVDGGSVSEMIRATGGAPLPLDQVLKVTEQIGRALEYAHAAGVVHRDVKPANVWLTREGVSKLGDFGLALVPRYSDLSHEGMIIGTVHYMAPEQAQGQKAQTATDIYSLGAMLYEMVTGHTPFRSDQTLGVLSQHIHTPPVAPSWHNADLPKALETLILRMLAKKPEERPDAREVVQQAIAMGTSAAALAEVAARREEKPLSRLAEGVFVGREPVLSQLRKAVNESAAGQGRLVLLSGEPGSGKTRTSQQVATHAELRGLKVLVGRCYEGEGAPAFWPWLQIIRAFSASLDGRELQSVMGPATADIAHVVSEVRNKLPDLPPPPQLEPDKARFRLFDSITTFLKNAGQRQALVLILDDLHWADQASLLLLEFLAREMSASRLLILGTFRDQELTRQHPLTRTLGELARHGTGQRIHLEGLSRADVARLFELSSGVEAPEPLVAAVHEQTEGNPFFVTEVVRLLVSEGKLEDVGGQRTIDVPIPQSVREVLQRRLERLSHECGDVLTTASAIGRHFQLATLAALEDVPEDELLDLLDEAVDARLIVESDAAPGEFSFIHALVRDTLYDQIRATRRTRLHHRIAVAIETASSSSPDSALPALAFHFSQSTLAEDASKAIHYSLLAAARATRLLAYEEAIEHYEHAVTGLEKQPEERARLCEALVSLGEAQARGGMLDRSRATFESAAALARDIAAADLFARAVLGIAPGAIGVRYGKPDSLLIDLGEEALRSTAAQDSSLRARLLAHMSLAHYHAPKQRRLDLSQEAVEMARRVGDPRALLPALYSRSIALMGFDEARQRLDVSLELAREAEAAGSKEMALRGHFGCFRELLELGERPALDEALAQYARVAAELRQPAYSWLTPFGQSVVAMTEGRLDDCERLAMESMAIGKRAKDVNATLFFSVQIVTLRGLQGRSGEVADRVKSFLDEYPFIPSWRATLAKIYYDMDRAEDAHREMEILAEHDFTDHPRDGAFVVGMALLGQVSSWLGETRVARLLYDLLLPFAGRNVIIGTSAIFYGPVARHLGLLAAALGKWDEAEAHFDRAIEMNTRMRSLPFLTYAQIESANALLRSGRAGKREKAAALVEQGLKTARRLGMQKAVQDAEAVTARL